MLENTKNAKEKSCGRDGDRNIWEHFTKQAQHYRQGPDQLQKEWKLQLEVDLAYQRIKRTGL